jgi:hypothetical protein
MSCAAERAIGEPPSPGGSDSRGTLLQATRSSVKTIATVLRRRLTSRDFRAA